MGMFAGGRKKKFVNQLHQSDFLVKSQFTLRFKIKKTSKKTDIAIFQ